MSRIPEKKGEIQDIDTNEVVGEHKGVYFYTIGQREGLQIGGQEIPYFVVDKDISENIVYVGHGNNHPKLYKSEVELENIHWIGDEPDDLENLEAAIRYRQKPKSGKLKIPCLPAGRKNEKLKEEITFSFNEPQRAISSGQSLVIYQGDECLGGGVIR